MRICTFEEGCPKWLDEIRVLPEQLWYVDGLTARDANREYLDDRGAGMPCRQYFVLEDERPVGIFTLSIRPRNRYEPGTEGTAYYLGRLMLDQGAQGRGLGRQIAAAAAALCREGVLGTAAWCYLSCNRENTPGIRAYERAGFQKLPIDYDEWEDLYRLSL
ncbi:MAG: GNAT family N-acetyltransferase [Ruminococcaceae bacterium]|nr:GNAT family N-acetyltransferase [Oscillospiraceae bacterium]